MKNSIIAIIVVAIGILIWFVVAGAKDTTAPTPITVSTGTQKPYVAPETGTPTTAEPSTLEPVTFTVEGSMPKFAPNVLSVKKGQPVTIIFKNIAGMHDLVIDEFAGARTQIIKAGETETITFTADKAGSFEYYCSVGTHRAMGMVGTLTVTE